MGKGVLCVYDDPNFYESPVHSSRNCQVFAPSKRRTRTEAISSGSKLPRFTPCLAPSSGTSGSQCVTQPQILQRMLRIVRSPHTYSTVDSGCPVMRTLPNAKYTQGPPLRRHKEQLHWVASVGVAGSVSRTAPQWQDPSCMNFSSVNGVPHNKFGGTMI